MSRTANPYAGQREPLPAEVRRAGFRHEFVDLGAVVLSYLRGPRTGPPLVLIPAQMGTWTTYRKVLRPLSRHFEVFVIEVRGHGNSSWTPGDYSWSSCGDDLRQFLATVVGRPAVIAGNSSGGVLALWCAAEAPEWTAAVVFEDPPLFSAEMPRFRDQDRFVHQGLQHVVQVLDGSCRLADYFRGLELPVSERRTKRLPAWFVDRLDRAVARYEDRHPGRPSGVDAWWAPNALDDLVRSLSMFDPRFAQAFVDGHFFAGFSHETALDRVRCPVLLLHGRWRRLPGHGLVGAMDDDDAERVCRLAPQTVYRRIEANHVLHRYRPRQYVRAIRQFLVGAPRRSRPEPAGTGG